MNEWMDDAACATTDPELFFADESKGWRQMDAAKKICAGCPALVRLACLEATPEDDHFSVRGGLTARERARARRRNAA